MKRALYRMILGSQEETPALPPGIAIRPYSAKDDHDAIPRIYGRSFGEPNWRSNWDQFPEFDPQGMFVAQDVQCGRTVGYVISFRRRDHGYVSVLAVLPEYRRRGIGSVLVHRAISYLRARELQKIVVDAPAESPAAVGVYRKAGFGIQETFEDEYEAPEAEPSAAGDADKPRA